MVYNCYNNTTTPASYSNRRDVVLTKGCSANKKSVATHPKNSLFWNSFKLTLKQNMKKVWERRSHEFPPHYTPAHHAFGTVSNN